jgi:hypothetical protein
VSDAPTRATAQVLALLDDAASGAALLELASPLARMLKRELSVIYVESSRSLVAAALPITRVLAHSRLQWMPLSPGDVEQGFRAHQARLRQLTARVALRDALQWSLRVVRGNLGETAEQLRAESDLLLLAHAPPPGPRTAYGAQLPRRRLLVVTVGESDGAGQRALQVATRLARVVEGVVQIAHIDRSGRNPEPPGLLDALGQCDLLVLPHATLDPVAMALLPCPVLLVG